MMIQGWRVPKNFMPFSTDYLIDYIDTRYYFVREIVTAILVLLFANFYLITQLFPLSFSLPSYRERDRETVWTLPHRKVTKVDNYATAIDTINSASRLFLHSRLIDEETYTSLPRKLPSFLAVFRLGVSYIFIPFLFVFKRGQDSKNSDRKNIYIYIRRRRRKKLFHSKFLSKYPCLKIRGKSLINDRNFYPKIIVSRPTTRRDTKNRSTMVSPRLASPMQRQRIRHWSDLNQPNRPTFTGSTSRSIGCTHGVGGPWQCIFNLVRGRDGIRIAIRSRANVHRRETELRGNLRGIFSL